jgi:acyl carrier protein phosphodiesterase
MAIDHFTDAHPATEAIRTLYAKHFRHLGGVLADVTYDHFLAAQWSRFHDGELVPFTEHIYATLEENAALCPDLLQECLPRMRQQNWLASYADLDGVAETLRRMSHRLSSKPKMQDAVVILDAHYAELKAHFEEFFPQLQAHVKERRKT